MKASIVSAGKKIEQQGLLSLSPGETAEIHTFEHFRIIIDIDDNLAITRQARLPSVENSIQELRLKFTEVVRFPDTFFVEVFQGISSSNTMVEDGAAWFLGAEFWVSSIVGAGGKLTRIDFSTSFLDLSCAERHMKGR